MGWKGTVQSLQVASNQAARERQRRQREHERQQAALSKMAELERAAAEVAMFEDYIRGLETLHSTEVDEVDWTAISESAEPSPPQKRNNHEETAKRALEDFKPKMLESKKRQEARQQQLTSAVTAGAEQDLREHEAALEGHAIEVEKWRSDRVLAQGVLRGDLNSLVEASKQIQGFSGFDYLTHLTFTFSDENPHAVVVGVAPVDDIVPGEQKSLLASGKLSVKQMTKGRYFELYQDYVCGAALLVANAVLGMLPLERLVVTVETEMLNTATGHIEEAPILSIYVPRETMARLNMGRVDASDAMSNFVHNMKFRKTQGFEIVDVVQVPEGG